jgi:ketosteroid isomerase-like protein
MDVIRESFSPDAVLHFAGNNAMSGTYRGVDAVMDAMGRALQGWGPHTEVEALLASDDHVLTFFRASSERDGKTLDVVVVLPIKVDAQGKMSEIWLLANDQEAYDQFWS